MAPLPRWAVLAPLLLGAASPAGPRTDTVLLFHSNDLHGHVEALPAMAGIVKAERAKRADVLWLDAGDAISGTPVSTVFQGTPIFAVEGLAGIEAACLGNHEFDHGAARIPSFLEAAPFPILCANARSAGGKPLADAEWTVIPVDGVRVGIVGILTEKTPAMTVKKGNEGIRFEPARAALERLVPVVREKCDLLVALTHVGYDDDLDLARAVKGVDVFVGGHSHTDLPGPVAIGSAVVVQASCYGQRLGRLEVTVDLDARRMASFEGRPIPIDPAKPPRDAAVAAAVDELEKKVAAQVNVVVGTAIRDLGRDDLKALAERVMKERLDADFGFQNDGGVRRTIPRGRVTVRTLWETFPFDNTLVRVKIKGSRLPAALARGRTIDPERTYTVATHTFVVDHLEKYLPGAEADGEDSGVPLRDAIVDWVRKNPELR